MKPLRWALVATAFAGCSGVSVTTDHDPETDFARLKTWDWFPAAKAPEDSVMSLTNSRVERALAETLNAKGFPPAAGAKPDFHVAYKAWVQQRLENVPSTRVAASYSYGWRRTYVVAGGTELRTYDEGTLVVDIIDPASKTLLWRGTARSAVEPSASPEKRDEKIRKAVRELLESFPPAR